MRTGGIPAPAFCIRRTRITGAGKRYNLVAENGFTTPDHLGIMAGDNQASGASVGNGGDEPFVCSYEGKRVSASIRQSYLLSEERVAINRNNRQKETAERFVTFLLSEQIQGEDVEDGFPSPVLVWNMWKQRQIVMSYGTGNWERHMIYGIIQRNQSGSFC